MHSVRAIVKMKHYKPFGLFDIRMSAAIPAFQGGVSPRQGHFRFLAALAVGSILFAAPLPAQFVYLGGATPTVYGYSIGSSGTLTPIPGSPFPTGSSLGNPIYIATDPGARFAYVINGGIGSVSIYSIGSTGALSSISGSPFALPTSGLVAIDPTGKFLYLASPTMSFPIGGEVLAYSIGSDGTLTAVPGSPFTAGAYAYAIAADPTAPFVYVANNRDATISAYSIGSKGALTAVPGSPFATGTSPMSVAIDPAGKFAYVTGVGDNTLSGYNIGSNGALTSVPGAPFATGKFPNAVTVSPSAKFVYVANLLDNTVSAYSIESNGALTSVSGSPFASGKEPYSVAIDPTDKFAYVTNETGNTISAYSIGSSGALSPVPNSPFTTVNSPGSIIVTPFVPFAVSSASLEIESELATFVLRDNFTLGANTKGISPHIENVTLQIGTFSVTVPPGSFKKKPTGKFVFNGTINGVSLNLQIVPLGSNSFRFIANGKGLDLGVTDPVAVLLTIGIDSGTTTVAHHQN